jgi:uncharacterized membrane protein YadS
MPKLSKPPRTLSPLKVKQSKKSMIWRKAIFTILVVFCLSPLGSPVAAIILGIGMALSIGMPIPKLNGRFSQIVFGASVALLGFGTDGTTAIQSLKSGIVFAIAGALVVLLFFYVVGKLLKVQRPLRVAMMLPAGSDGEQKLSSVSLFISLLSLIALPFIAHLWQFAPDQLGIWSAIVVPDAAAAIGSPQAFGRNAVNVAVPLVLVRVLLITVLGWLYKGDSKDDRTIFPWFIVIYILVTVFRTYAPVSIFPSVFDAFVNLGNAGVILSLFLLATRIQLWVPSKQL